MGTAAYADKAATPPPRVTTAPLEQPRQCVGLRALEAGQHGNQVSQHSRRDMCLVAEQEPVSAKSTALRTPGSDDRVGRALPRPPRAPAPPGEAGTPPIDRSLPRSHTSSHDSTRSAPPLAAGTRGRPARQPGVSALASRHVPRGESRTSLGQIDSTEDTRIGRPSWESAPTTSAGACSARWSRDAADRSVATAFSYKQPRFDAVGAAAGCWCRTHAAVLQPSRTTSPGLFGVGTRRVVPGSLAWRPDRSLRCEVEA